MSARSALGISRLFSHRLQRKRQADHRNLNPRRTRQRQTRSLLVEALEERRLLVGNDDLTIVPPSPSSEIHEPHLIYWPHDTPQTVYGQIIAGDEWEGGTVQIQFGGTAQYSSTGDFDSGDFTFVISAHLNNLVSDLSFNPVTRILTFNTASGVGFGYSLTYAITAVADSVEPGATGESATENISIDWVPQSDLSGSANITLHDLKEGVEFSVEQDTTSELGPPPGTFTLQPKHSGYSLSTFVEFQVESPNWNSAKLGIDYGLSAPVFWPVDIYTPSYQLELAAIDDDVLEGDEKARVRVYVPAINSTSDWEEVTITENYKDAQVEKDEPSDCSACKCHSCVDGNAVTYSPHDGSVRASLADGILVVSSADQDFAFPTVYVGITLPNPVPASVVARIQVIEKQTDSFGNLQGLGRKLVAGQSDASVYAGFETSSLQAGQTYWFAMQANLSPFVELWTLGQSGGPSSGASGIAEKIIPLEVQVDAYYPETTPPISADDKISGWIGRTSHVLRDPNASSLGPEMGGGLSVPGGDRLIQGAELLLPDIPAGAPAPQSSGGKVKTETGAMLVRAGGAVSWYADGAGSSFDSMDVLAGNTLTDRANNKKIFDAHGLMTQYIDANGNATTYEYVNSGPRKGALTKITYPSGQETQFTVSQPPGENYSELNISSRIDARRDYYIRRYLTGDIVINFEDPDGGGPRAARRDIVSYNEGRLSSIRSGTAHASHSSSLDENLPIHQTSISASSGSSTQINYPDGSRTVIDLSRRTNRLIAWSAYAPGQMIQPGNPTFLRIASLSDPVMPGYMPPMPNYVAVTHYRSGSAVTPMRTIMRMDHRGRVIRMWDPEQVKAIAEENPGALYRPLLPSWTASLDSFSTVFSNYTEFFDQLHDLLKTKYDLSYEYLRTPTQRDQFGRIVGQDYGESLSVTTPVQNADGVRQTTTWTYVDGNPVSQQRPLQTQELSVWNNQFDRLTQATDATGNNFHQQLDAEGRVIQQRWEQSATTSPPSPAVDLAVVNYQYVTDVGLPNTLVSSKTVQTGRSSGPRITDYEYVTNVPPTDSRFGKLHSIIETNSVAPSVTTFSYDQRGNVETITDPAGRVTTLWQDNRNQMTARLSPDPDGIGPLLPVLERFDYDVFGNVIATETINSYLEADGATLRVTALRSAYSYDLGNRLIEEVAADPDGKWYWTALSSNGPTEQRIYSGPLEEFLLNNLSSSNISTADLIAYASGTSLIANLPGELSTDEGFRRSYSYFANGSNDIQSTERDLSDSANINLRITTSTLDRLNRIVKLVSPHPGSSLSTVPGQILEAGRPVTTYQYDNLSNQTAVTDALGNTTTTSYDQLNRPTAVNRPNPVGVGSTTTTAYAYQAMPNGWKVTSTNPLGQVVSTQYDSLSRPVSVTGDTPNQFYDYWTDGLLRSVTDELSRTTDYDYDRRGRLSNVLMPAPVVGESRPIGAYTYTIDDLLIQSNDPLDRVTTYNYDAGGRLIRTTQPDPDGTDPLLPAYQQLTLDSLGNTLVSGDALGQTTNYRRDGWHRVISSRDPSAALTQFKLDAYGNLTELVDALGNQTFSIYNAMNQVVQENKPIQGTDHLRIYSYDAVGNLRSMTDRNGRTTELQYDRLYRNTAEIWKVGSTTIPENLQYTYDAIGNLLSAGSNSLFVPKSEFIYNDRNQVILERQRHVELRHRSTHFNDPNVNLKHTYDAVGNRTSTQLKFKGTLVGQEITGSVNDLVNTYNFDQLNRLTSVSQTGNLDAQGNLMSGSNAVAPKTVSFVYDLASQIQEIQRYADTSATGAIKAHSRYFYDQAGRLTNITHGKGSLVATAWNASPSVQPELVAAYDFTYDVDNRLTNLASLNDRTSTTYSYDTRDQLTGAVTTAIGGMAAPVYLPPAENYSFDGTGNRHGSGGAGQSAQGTHNRLQSDGVYNYIYDNEGNVTQRTEIATGKVRQLNWDHRNRLRSVWDWPGAVGQGLPDQWVDYFYDAFDRLTRKNYFKSAGNNITMVHSETRVWDGQQVLIELTDRDGSAGGVLPRVSNRYLYGQSVDMLLADEQYWDNSTGYAPGASASPPAVAVAGQTLWPLSDHLGSVRDVMDNDGVIRQHLVFDSFGRRLSEQDFSASGQPISSLDPAAVDELFGYTGREWDKEAQLQYNRARWYDPSTGRWLSQDPIGFEAGDENLYRYVENDPMGATDPSGKKVYWVARDLASFFVGNHGFVLIVPDSPEDFRGIIMLVDLYGGNKGCTIGGFKGIESEGDKSPGKLVVRFRDPLDIASVQEYFDPELFSKSRNKQKSGWSAELHEVTPPIGMTDSQFILKLIELARNYQAKEPNAPKYHLFGPNCQSFTFSLFLAAGIDRQQLIILGKFWGLDVGEAMEIDLELFR